MVGSCGSEEHRRVKGESLACCEFPTSIFKLVGEKYGGSDAIHRCFSLARLYGAKMYVEELIPVVGQMATDTNDFIYLGNGDPSKLDDVRAEFAEKVNRDEKVRYVIHEPCKSNNEPGRFELKAWRITFWKNDVTSVVPKGQQLEALNGLSDSDCIGYMLLQKAGIDKHSKGNVNGGELRWIVYEAVLSGGGSQRGIVPRQPEFSFHVGTCNGPGCYRVVHGHMYCQQNGRTAVCAHVAIRTLLSALLPERDISYNTISKLADYKGGSMDTRQIIRVFNSLGFCVHNYAVRPSLLSDDRKRGKTYHRLYLGIESGGGSLLGFEVMNSLSMLGKKSQGHIVAAKVFRMLSRMFWCFSRMNRRNPRHIIPLFGHTFNKHIWVNEASGYYFLDGVSQPRSFVSDNWVSTFLGHDDNVGPNIYVPRFYIEKFALSSVISIIPRRFKLPERPDSKEPTCREGAWVEREAVDILKGNIANILLNWHGYLYEDNVWIGRLYTAITGKQLESTCGSAADDGRTQFAKVVLRCLLVSSSEYVEYLKENKDWDGNSESTDALEMVEDIIQSEFVWMVEVSLPHLFPVNERKVAEILFTVDNANFKADARCQGDDLNRGLLLVRLPTRYIWPNSSGCSIAENCLDYQSSIKSHMPCFSFKTNWRVGNDTPLPPQKENKV